MIRVRCQGSWCGSFNGLSPYTLTRTITQQVGLPESVALAGVLIGAELVPALGGLRLFSETARQREKILRNATVSRAGSVIARIGLWGNLRRG